MYALVTTLDRRSFGAICRQAFAEMLDAGITTVGEFHYLHHDTGGEPYEDPNALGLAVIEAARQAGIRITLIDACYLRGGITDPEPEPGQRRFCDPSAEAWAERVAGLSAGPSARIGAAIHSVRAVDPEAAAVVAAATEQASRPLHAHVSEQPAENEACLSAYGRTPTAVLADAGALTDHFTAIHATHLTEDDERLLGEARACCCICPTTERDLADGIGSPRRLLDAGCRLAFGSDSNTIIDPFEEARACELDERLAGGERVRQTPGELIAAATAGGQRSLGWPEAGSIAAGQLADLITLDLETPRMAGIPTEHLLAGAVFSAAAGDVRDVIVGGQAIVSDGAHAKIDVAAELDSSIAALDRI
jgi:formiminoglutamate deiminase